MAVTFLRLPDNPQRPCRIAIARKRGDRWVHPLVDVMGASL